LATYKIGSASSNTAYQSFPIPFSQMNDYFCSH